MCGIAGIIDFNNKTIAESSLKRMIGLMNHRGPDDSGFYIGESAGLGQCRLSIIDLSSAGHQPMPDRSKTRWIVFNGEIYNFIELRDELMKLGHEFLSKNRYGGDPASLRRMGGRLRQKIQRHVGFCHLGRKEERTILFPGPFWHQALLLLSR